VEKYNLVFICCLFAGSYSMCCYTDSNGNNYDLSSLSLPDRNYELMSTDGTMRFALSICTSLVHTRGLFLCIFSYFFFLSLYLC